VKVLLVDDSPDDRFAFRRALSKAATHYLIEEAADAESALALLGGARFDVIVLDQHLPGEPGTWLLERVREMSPSPAVVMLTGSDAGQAATRAIEGGVDDYLLKDEVTPGGIDRAIQNALVRRQIARRVERLAQRQRELLDLTARLSRLVRLDDIQTCVLGYADEVLDARGGGIFVVEESGRRLRLSRVMGEPQPEAGASEPCSLAAAALAEDAMVLAPDSAALRREHPDLLERAPDTESAAALPLTAEGAVPSVLGLRFGRPLDDDEATHLRVFAELAADAVRRAHLYERMLAQAEFEQRLLGVVSHDLRNPLGTIAMGLDVLSEEAPAGIVAKMDRAVARMKHMVDDLLDLTRARSGQLLGERTEVTLADVLGEVVEGLRARHPEVSFEVTAPAGASVRGDRQRLLQVFDNLGTNALKYGDPERGVRFAVTPSEGATEVAVHNWGEPIDEADVAGLFEAFSGTKSGAHARDSLGLGLYIVERIVSAHGGAVAVRSSREAGTTFRVTLPADA